MPHPDPEVRRLRQAAHRLRQAAHRAFDPLWQTGLMTRKEAYRWLAARLGVYEYEAHMGNMEDKDLLRRVVVECHDRLPPPDPGDDFPDDL